VNYYVGNKWKEPATAKHGTRVLPRHLLTETDEITKKKLGIADHLGTGLSIQTPEKETELPTRKRRPRKIILKWIL
jgi:hypothetical protein